MFAAVLSQLLQGRFGCSFRPSSWAMATEALGWLPIMGDEALGRLDVAAMVEALAWTATVAPEEARGWDVVAEDGPQGCLAAPGSLYGPTMVFAA
ncbi:UNVERIFIED_CONTAM: hypothetical protein K2H54_054251 [Gekko kuhli]